MKINSIFQAIEGEGLEVGIPKIFIRTQGCNMNCIHCDTPEAQNFNKGKEMSVKQIMSKVNKYNQRYVTITGGNPLQQPPYELLSLVRQLRRKNYHTTIEVTGSDEIYNTDRNHIYKIFNLVDFISFDMKSPSAHTLPFHNSSVGWNFKSQYKIVIEDWDDYNFAKEMIKKYVVCKIVLTPCWKVNEELSKDFISKLEKKVLKDRLRTRIIVQQHKFIHGPNKRDV